MLKTILVIEDEKQFQKEYRAALASRCQLLQAFNLKEARDMALTRMAEIDIIIADGHLDRENTLQLIGQLRAKGFRGAIIAASNDPFLLKQMMKVGCDRQVAPHRDKVDAAIEIALACL